MSYRNWRTGVIATMTGYGAGYLTHGQWRQFMNLDYEVARNHITSGWRLEAWQ